MALYVNEHWDIYGNLTITNEHFKLNAKAHISSEIYPLEIFVERFE